MNAATVTPARTRAPVARAAPTERPRTYASATATVAPAKAATGTSCPDVPTDPYAIAQSPQRQGTPRARTPVAVRACDASAITLRAFRDLRDDAREVDDARPPARRDTVVDRHDAVAPHGGHLLPARPLGHGRRRL